MKDVIIIGAGAAGMTAGIYAIRYDMDIEICGELAGGTATEAFKIENYPGFPEIGGMELMEKFKVHVESLGGKIENSLVTKITKQENSFVAETESGKTLEAKNIILATGTKRRKLGIPGEEEFSGKGVVYCATCDGPLFKGKEVAVIGGGNAATMAAVMLAEYCPQVYLIVRKSKLKGEPVWSERAKANDKIEMVFDTNVTKINGETLVSSVDTDNDVKKNIPVQGVFIEIGAEMRVELAEQLGVKLNEGKRIIVDEDQRTNVKGVFAAGDVASNTGHFAQIVNSASQGARAAYGVFQRLENK